VPGKGAPLQHFKAENIIHPIKTAVIFQLPARAADMNFYIKPPVSRPFTGSERPE